MINWEDINTKSRTNGSMKTICPNCSHTRKKKKDPCLYVNLDDGVAKCYNCDELAFRDGFKEPTQKKYTLPSQEWRNYTKLSENLTKWFEEQRGIKQFTLNHFKITEENVYQPAISKNTNSISFNYFERDTLVNKKFRDGAKNFTQTSGGKPILYNINSCIGAEEVYILEGEIDVLSVWQIGKKHCVSLPSGANDNDNYWLNSEPYLKDVKKFYIGTDNDEKGDEVAEKIAQRLGRYRCERIKWTNKDANEDLVAGILEESIKNTIEYPVSGTIRHSDILSNMLALKQNGVPKTIKPKSKRFESLNNVFSILMGQLTTVTGIPSHGKSNFIEDYVLALSNDFDYKVSLFSPEHSPTELHAMNLANKVLGKNSFKASDEEVINYSNWANERIYFTSPSQDETPTWKWLIETFKAQMLRFGINIFVIDAWNKVILEGQNEFQEIRKILTQLTAFAQQNNVHIFLIAHPTKMQKIDKSEKYKIPDLYNVSGSADFRNQTHNGLCVYRDFEEGVTKVVNLKTKMSFQGEIGAFGTFVYDVSSARYNCQSNNELDKVNYINNTIEVKIDNRYELPKLDPKVAFLDQTPYVIPNENEDVPF